MSQRLVHLSASRWAATLPLVGTAASVLLVVGGFWDGWWHFNIGRDTFWTPPHVLMYAHVVVSLALALIGAPDWRLRPAAVVTGLGGLIAVVAAPVDNFWHAIFGLDFTIWSLPHAAGIVAGGTVSLLGIATWWLVVLHALRAPIARWLAWSALSLQVAVLLVWLLFTLMEYEYSLIARLTIPYRWDLQAAYYPIFIAYLTFAVAIGMALTGGTGVVSGGAVLAYLLLLVLGQWLKGDTPLPLPVPLFLPITAVAIIAVRHPGMVGSFLASVSGVPLLYAALVLAGRPVPLNPASVAAAMGAGLAGAVAGRFLSRAMRLMTTPG